MTDRTIKKKALPYILYALSVLPIFIFRDFTPDNELRYLSIADEALRNHTIFTFVNHGLIYADKPPLYLWIVMLGKSIFGYHNMLFLGIFSFVPALVVIYVMDQWVKNVLSEYERLPGQLMLMTSGFFIGTAVVLRMDMLMCMFIILALRVFFKMYSGNGKPHDSILFPLFVFLAVFAKGPMGIIVPLVSTITFLMLKKDIKTIGKYWGWKTGIILLTLCAFWFSGVYNEGGIQYLDNLLFNQTINRAVNAFHHKESFYYYFVAIWYSLAPWSLLLITIFLAGLKKRLATTDLERFFLVIVLSTFVTLSLFSSKLAIYMLPAFPFIVYLSMMWLGRLGSPRWMFFVAGIPAGIFCLAFPVVFVTQRILHINELSANSVVFLAALILSLSGILTMRYLINHKLNIGITTMCCGMLTAVFAVSFAIPKYNSMIGLNQLCNQASKTAMELGAENYYYCEMSRADNLDVYLGVQPEMLKIKDLYEQNRIKTPAILFTRKKAIERNDSLQMFLKGKKAFRTGNSYCITIDNKIINEN